MSRAGTRDETTDDAASTIAAPLTVSRPALLVGGGDAAFRGFIHDFLAYSACVAQIRAGFGEAIGLTGVAYTTLVSIAHLQGDDGVGVARLAEHVHLSGAFVTIEVMKLVKAGLVDKRVNGEDRRRVLLTVSDAGRQQLDALAALQVPVNDALFEALTAEEFASLRRMMSGLVRCGERALARQRATLAATKPGIPAGGRAAARASRKPINPRRDRPAADPQA